MDFIETFASVPKFQSITCLIAVAAYYGLEFEQMDVMTALSNRDVNILDEFKKEAPPLRL
jgi:hypothetical protein